MAPTPTRPSSVTANVLETPSFGIAYFVDDEEVG